ASGFEDRDPVKDFYAIMNELVSYNPKLGDKAQIIVANKMDIPGAQEGLEKIKNEFESKNIKVFSTSAATQEGIQQLKYGIWDLLSATEVIYDTFDEEFIEEIIEEEKIIVKKEDGQYIVEGSYMEDLINSIYFDDVDSLRYFQETLRRQGVVEELEQLGINEGESVFICGYEFEFFH